MAKLGRPKTGLNGKKTTLYLDPALVGEARVIARTRYKESLSNMIERLMRAETQRKLGGRLEKQSGSER